MSTPVSTLLWFRQDLRVTDNEALTAAIEIGAPIVPVFIFSPEEEGAWAPGGASRWWLHGSLSRLDEDLRRLGSRLILRKSRDSCQELLQLARECNAKNVLWNRRYEPCIVARDRRVKSEAREAALEAHSFNGALLREPWSVSTKAGAAYQVFSPFWRYCLSLADPLPPLASPHRMPAPEMWPESLPLEQLKLLPRINWAGAIGAAWTPGSASAQASLELFLKQAFDEYGGNRDRPDTAGTSRLSPHLHFGEISPREVWHAVRSFALARGQHSTWRESRFLTELGWREFAYHLLYHFPHLPDQPLNSRFADFPWNSDAQGLSAWQRGTTGYPIVDAGMRQLWQTGWMHNRVRMIAASFLVKDLLLPWTQGAQWFWDTLVDADLASNTLGWQWVAGCGADAAPYFRIFNPVTQATRFDPDGTYVRGWVPELARLPREWIHRPWAAPPSVLSDAGVQLGINYPQRLIDHDKARLAALTALATLKKSEG
ncbi:MAG: DNA photolyase family protein [Pseudomonadota bacterium]|nr:DNA photolyase family protein [Pseudomonadota bacterium]